MILKKIFFDRDDQIFLQKISNPAELIILDSTHNDKNKKQFELRIFYLILMNLWNYDVLVFFQRFIVIELFNKFLTYLVFTFIPKLCNIFF